MKNLKIRLLALLLACVVLMGLTACASGDAAEPTEEKTVIRVPEPVKYDKCTEMGTPLADVRVRRALAMAIDMDTVIAALYWETGETAGQWDYDPDGAKELLAEAGWPSEYVLDVVYYQTDPQIEDLLDVLVHYWDTVGIKAEIRKLETDVTAQLWTAPDDPEGDSKVKWDLAVCSQSDLTQQQYYSQFTSDSATNSHTPKIDGLDEAVDRGDLETAERILTENVSCIPLLYQDGFVCISDSLNTAATEAGEKANGKDILNWTTDREDRTLYTIGAPAEAELCPVADPGSLYHELVFDRLLHADSDQQIMDGGIAESYTVSANGLTAEFILREDLLWHDGEPLTAEDVKFTFELYLQCPDTDPVLTGVLEKLVGAKAFADGEADECTGIIVEENKVTFRFMERAEDVLTAFSKWPVLPRHKLENVKPAKLSTHKFWKTPVGSGPYKVAELTPGKTCLLERCEDCREAGDGNIDFIRMHTADDGISVLAARELLDYGWGTSTDDGVYIAGLEHMEVAPVERSCMVNIFINQYPHESYFTLEESTEPTE